MTEDDETWLTRAVELATANVDGGGGPFGAVVVCDDALVATGQNRVTRDLDPTAHAEVVAIGAACTVLDRFALDGCTLYASCEPCPLCLSASLWARLDRVVYAADREDAARGGFDDRAFYDLWATPRAEWKTLEVALLRVPTATEPFDAWLTEPDRTAY